MSIQFTDLSETIRIKKGEISLKIQAFSAKEEDSYIVVSPTINVSGYGDTEEEAKESFQENLKLFCLDIMNLSQSRIDQELSLMGFKKELYKTKNYSKVYVDEHGILQGLDASSVKKSMVDFTEAVAV